MTRLGEAAAKQERRFKDRRESRRPERQGRGYEQSDFGEQGDSVDLVGYDPERDFTIQPWITERLGGPMQLATSSSAPPRFAARCAEIALFGKPFRVYAKLGRSGAGTHERGVFMPTSDLLALAPAIKAQTGQTSPMLEPGKVSGFLIELAPDPARRHGTPGRRCCARCDDVRKYRVTRAFSELKELSWIPKWARF